MQILVADDSKTNLTLITRTLESLGHVAIPATNGEKAIELFLKNTPDLIILDVVMEGMSGYECAKKLRSLQIENWIPIIFVSANIDDESIKQGIDAGGDDYLTKPFSDITLAAKIKAMQRISDMRTKLVETTKKLSLISSTDSLTNVYNRFYFDKAIIERLNSADRYKRLMGLFFIDIDNFKLINDTFGHPIGDILLREVSKRLQSCLRREDFIARIGGDEFSIIINESESLEAIGMIAKKIIDTLTPDFDLEEYHVRASVSIGIACYPYPGTTKDNILKHADIAMYHAKSLGRNNFQYFSETLNEKYKKHIELEYALKFALERKEMFLTYQPIFNLQNNSVCGLEVLVGWMHPKFGLIPPNIFIPIAEESGMITTIGTWVFRTACEETRKWGLDDHDQFKLSITLFPQQISHDKFFETVIDCLSHNKMVPSLLELSITESTVINYRSDAFKIAIQNLHNMGISIAIGNFGTGYSSLTDLISLEIDTLKIDKIFIQNVMTDSTSAIIVNSLIGLGENLGLKIVAEGIEKNEQLDFLLEKHCQYGQGSLLSGPLSPDKVSHFLKKLERTTE